ncbi:MAG: hypothetical protein KF688_03860 [Pirellulales bacterium]|nr:hypothetical protein [Pirellulales bacterium]MBX3433615.1 hypothetical protein [Pirellulales bacterium]
MRHDWRHILSWTEVLCFVLVWSIGIGATVAQFYAQKGAPDAADVASTRPAGGGPALLD